MRSANLLTKCDGARTLIGEQPTMSFSFLCLSGQMGSLCETYRAFHKTALLTRPSYRSSSRR